VSRYDLFRKRIAPIAFIVAMGLLIRETCQGEQRIHATIVIGTGDAEPRVQAIDAQLIVNGEAYGEVHRRAQPGLRIGAARFAVAMPEADGELIIDVDLGTEKRHVMRRIHASENATIELDLSSDLR
jgi:hypothetical protein